MVCYVHDTNGILTECLKSRKDKELTQGFTVLYDYLVPPGLETFMTKNEITYQLDPLMIIDPILLRNQSAPGMTTLLRVSPAQTLSFHSTSGIDL